MPSRKASLTASRSSGRAVSRPTRTPMAVSDLASSPAFVSRVSPTVSSLPMLSSSAVRRRRDRTGSGTRASVPRRGDQRHCRSRRGALYHRQRPRACPGAPSRSPTPGRPNHGPAATAPAERPARPSRACRPAGPDRCHPRGRDRPSSAPTSSWPGRRSARSPARSGGSSALAALAIAVVLLAALLWSSEGRSSWPSGCSDRWAGASSTASCWRSASRSRPASLAVGMPGEPRGALVPRRRRRRAGGRRGARPGAAQPAVPRRRRIGRPVGRGRRSAAGRRPARRCARRPRARDRRRGGRRSARAAVGWRRSSA